MNVKPIYYEKLFLILFSVFVFLSHVNAGEKVTINLQTLYLDPISRDLRQTFNDYLRNKELDMPREMHTVKSEHLHVFKEKFIVLQIEDGDFGGYFITIVISPKNMQVWRLWIYETDKKKYQIRQLENTPIRDEERKEFDALLSKQYLQYWL